MTPPQGGRNYIEKPARFVPGLCLGSVLGNLSSTPAVCQPPEQDKPDINHHIFKFCKTIPSMASL